jgi:hypothetical protein
LTVPIYGKGSQKKALPKVCPKMAVGTIKAVSQRVGVVVDINVAIA